MDIDNQVNQIVQNIITDIVSKVQLQVAGIVDKKVTEVINGLDTAAILADQLNKKLDARLNQLSVDTKTIEAQLESKSKEIANGLSLSLQHKAIDAATEYVNAQVSKLDFRQICESALFSAIKNQTFSYPANSIPAQAIDTNGWTLSGDNISGGIVKNFSSTGIDDRASSCQLTLLNDVTVIENNLLTKDLTVKGSTTIEGDLIVTGNVPENSNFYINLVNSTVNNVRTSLDRTLFENYSSLVYEKIKLDGLDLSAIKLNGQEIINSSRLSNQIIESNLQKVGILRELQVSAESFLSGTLYTTINRVGINTIEPGQALSIWDQEVEIGFGKKANNIAIIETPRNQTLILSSNGKNNLTLDPEGTVTVNGLAINGVVITASPTPPSDNQPAGVIVFNANPNYGGPVGWVSLGGARWANFGIIE
jgi:hypothetical protein